ncbi:MAG: rod shape-determining protein MreC [Candidatus Aminicenantes bacterium 4484_214]|nr:MAG: rod shape-determining protein MreC [Candidatus Aminicenantes bacterium 4484_214]RLE10202.1 MAG: rod shape-determining protein MreC [Candidatus Aminicenantes bacterium]
MPFFLKKKSFIVLFSLLGLQFIFLSLQLPQGGHQSFLEKWIFGFLANTQSGLTYIIEGAGNLWSDYIALHQARKENKELKEKIVTLTQENLLLQDKLTKKEKSSQAIQNLAPLNKSIVLAQVIGLDPANYFRTVVINRGQAQGLAPNMVVLDEKGHLIGRLIDPVSWQAATVQLVTDTNFAASVRTKKKNLVGILSGDGHGRCFLKYILETETDVEEGEELVTTGYDGVFFAGLPVGKISAIYATQGLFKSILVQPYFNFHNLEIVAVIKTSPKESF